MPENKKITTLSDFCGTTDDSINGNSMVNDDIEDIDSGDIDVNMVDFGEDESDDSISMNSYYLCGVKETVVSHGGDTKPELKMVFTFKKHELHRAMVNSAQYNTLSPEERLDFNMEYHAMLGSACICAAYTSVAEDMLWVVKAEETEKEWSEEELKEYIESLDMGTIRAKAINFEDMLENTPL